MKINYIIFLFSMFFAFQSQAQNVSQQEAEIIAKNFINQLRPNKRSATSSTISQTIPQYYKGELSYYVVPFTDGGYTVVSAYDGYEPILMFAENGEFEESDPSPSFVWWMSLYSERIQELGKTNTKVAASTEKWEKYKNNELISSFSSTDAVTSVAPLLTSKWNQNSPYNSLIEDGGKGTSCSTSYGGKCAAGCVALSGSQVFRYWRYPANAYDWNNMPDQLTTSSTTTQKNAVGKLIAEVGKDVGMSYCSSGCSSGASTSNLRYVFERKGYVYESYTTFASNGQILQKIKAELNNKRPLITRGSSSTAGHSFVFDGYSGDMVHINWGWGGSQDGYFYIDNHNYTTGQAAIFGISPPCETRINAGEAIQLNPGMINTYLYTPPTYGYFETADNSYPANYRTITSGKHAAYNAYQEVTLNSGFTVEAGATIQINIVNCP